MDQQRRRGALRRRPPNAHPCLTQEETALPMLFGTCVVGVRNVLPEFKAEAPVGMTLTRREREVLGLVCLRLSDAEIAKRLFIGTRTVETHVGNILGKLGVANRREAIGAATRLNSTGSSVLSPPGGEHGAR